MTDLPAEISVREVGPRDGRPGVVADSPQRQRALLRARTESAWRGAAGFTEIEVVVSASETHNRKNVNRSTAESLDDIVGVIALAHERGATCQVIVSTAYGCPYEGDVPVERVLWVVD